MTSNISKWWNFTTFLNFLLVKGLLLSNLFPLTIKLKYVNEKLRTTYTVLGIDYWTSILYIVLQ